MKVDKQFGKKIIRIDEVERRTGLCRSTIYNKLRVGGKYHDPQFSIRISLNKDEIDNDRGGDREETSVGWYENELAVWIDSRPRVI